MLLNRLRQVASVVLPARTKRFLRDKHRDLVFRRAMKAFLTDPESCVKDEGRVVSDLIYGWGNEGWCAQQEFLVSCLRHALVAKGPILECGSGLSTILVAAVAAKRGIGYRALEHDPKWAAYVRRSLVRYSIDPAVVCVTPLKAFGEYLWYDVPGGSIPDGLGLVICDGPPGNTKGGRYGLVPIMKHKLRPGCIILLDDAERRDEQIIARRWKAELGGALEVLGRAKPYIRMTVPGQAPHSAPRSRSHSDVRTCAVGPDAPAI